MSSVIELYEQLSSAPDDKVRARVIAEAFARLEERYPEVTDLATRSGVSETELRLKKEIVEAEGRLRVELKETEARLQVEIRELENRLQAEMRELESRLQVQIHEVEGRLSRDIEKVRADTLRWMAGLLSGQTVVLLTAIFAIVRNMG